MDHLDHLLHAWKHQFGIGDAAFQALMLMLELYRGNIWPPRDVNEVATGRILEPTFASHQIPRMGQSTSISASYLDNSFAQIPSPMALEHVDTSADYRLDSFAGHAGVFTSSADGALNENSAQTIPQVYSRSMQAYLLPDLLHENPQVSEDVYNVPQQPHLHSCGTFCESCLGEM